jgi:hypothetical protein
LSLINYGITLNNNPTVEDLWNSTPVWGYPYISSGARVGPIAAPLINGALGQDVAGLGAYSLWNKHLYTTVSVYRSVACRIIWHTSELIIWRTGPESRMKLCGAGIFAPDSKLPTLLWISAAYARNDSVPDNPNKNVPTN